MSHGRRNLRGDLYCRVDHHRSGLYRIDHHYSDHSLRVRLFQPRKRRLSMPPAGTGKEKHLSIRKSAGVLLLVMVCCMIVVTNLVRRAGASTL